MLKRGAVCLDVVLWDDAGLFPAVRLFLGDSGGGRGVYAACDLALEPVEPRVHLRGREPAVGPRRPYALRGEHRGGGGGA